MKKCSNCKITKPLTDFYKRNRSKKEEYYSHCKECNRNLTKKRQRFIKLKAVNYKGGKCQYCGYNKCLGALQFHHFNDKDLKWDNFKLRKFNEKFKEELDKCILLCANCHSEVHTQYCI